MNIIHGEQLFQSRQQLQQLIDEAKKDGREIQRLTAKELNSTSLQQILGNQSLFGTPQTIVIEELHSLPRSSKKEELLTLVAQAATADPAMLNLIIWEKRDLTPTMLKKFKGAEVQQFKVSKYIFSLVEKINPNQSTKRDQLALLKKAIVAESDFFVFTMIIRQIRLLIQIKDSGYVSGPPFIVAKLKKQAADFSFEKLLTLHQRLLQIDLGTKQSSSVFTLAQELDLFITSM